MSNGHESSERPRWRVRRDRVERSDGRVRRGAARATRSLTGAASSLSERAVEGLLVSSERIGSAAEGRAVLASVEGREAVGDQLHRLVVLAVPVLRAVATGAKFTKVPWVLVGSAAVSTGITVRTGVRE